MLWYQQIIAISKNEEEAGASAPSKISIFCSAIFFATNKKKNTQNKHVCKICDLEVLFKTFFSKMYNKEKLFNSLQSP